MSTTSEERQLRHQHGILHCLTISLSLRNTGTTTLPKKCTTWSPRSEPGDLGQDGAWWWWWWYGPRDLTSVFLHTCHMRALLIRVAEHLGASSWRPRHPFPALMAGVSPGRVPVHTALKNQTPRRPTRARLNRPKVSANCGDSTVFCAVRTIPAPVVAQRRACEPQPGHRPPDRCTATVGAQPSSPHQHPRNELKCGTKRRRTFSTYCTRGTC